MSRTTIFRFAAIALITACSGSDATTSPNANVLAARSGEQGRNVAVVHLQDACDPVTFAGVPGGCQRDGGITFDHFISQVGRLGQAPAWRMNPSDLFLKEGNEFLATNSGGETHTFTEVDEFGGGIVPELNALAGLTEVAPECQALTSGDFIPSGASSAVDDADRVGDEKYQCCIHPWMRMTVHVAAR